MSFWSDLKEKHRWKVEKKKEKRREKWELFKKRLSCKHEYKEIKRIPMVERTINVLTGRSWISDRCTRVFYKCEKCDKEKTKDIQ